MCDYSVFVCVVFIFCGMEPSPISAPPCWTATRYNTPNLIHILLIFRSDSNINVTVREVSDDLYLVKTPSPAPPSPDPPTAQKLTEHMDVSLGDGVEAAARQQDDVGFGGFCHDFCRSLSSSVSVCPGPVRSRSCVVLCSRVVGCL